jgi:hypothetical protein
MSDRGTDRRIDELITDIETDIEDAEEELTNLFGIQAISSEEAEVSYQRTVSGAEEAKDASSDDETSQEPRSVNEESESDFDEEAAAYDDTVAETLQQLEREQPFNAYQEEEEESEDSSHNYPMAQSKELIVAGIKLQVRAAPTTTDETARALFPMEIRQTYPADKLSSLFEAIGKAQKNKFGLLTLALEDQDKLEDTYALQMLLEGTKEHFIQYGVVNVFTVIVFDENDMQNIIETHDILTNHSTVTMQQVAASNEWYGTMVEGDLGTGCRQNLTLSATFLMNNMEEGLKHRCVEIYMSFKPSEQGGPLLYKIMMDHLQCNTDAAGKALVTMLKKMKLNEIEGENVDKIVGLVRTTVQRLGKIQHSVTGASAIPDDLNESLLEVFKTSTVQKFTDIFNHLETSALAGKYALNGGKTNAYPSVNTLLDIAHNTYYDMSLANTWSGVTTKAKSTAFQASANTSSTIVAGTCWNCGGQHHLRECKVAKDRKRIDANKKKARAAAKDNGQGGRGGQGRGEGRGGRGGRGGGGRGRGGRGTPNPKWAEPTADEKKNNNERLINGKIYRYNADSKRWNPKDGH